MSLDFSQDKISHRTYFWLGVVIWIVMMIAGPVADYPWWTGFLLFPVCWVGAYVLVWRGQKDVEWAEKVSWQEKWMKGPPDDHSH